MGPKLITFDFGDTLVTSDPPYLDRMALALGELGCPRSLTEVTRAYFEADVWAATEMLQRAPFTPEEFQTRFSDTFFEALGLAAEAERLRGPMQRKLIELRPRRVMMPGAGELILRLHSLGYRLGIISNNDGRTREKCRSVGIEHFFSFILDSTQEGVMKPDPRIFQRALRLEGAEAAEVLHVGDLYGCDVMGAAAAGIPAVWLGNDLISPPAVKDCRRINGLLDLLGLLL